MSEFAATHKWLTDGVVVEVLCDGGEVYDRAHYSDLVEGRPGVAAYEVSDVDAEGNEEWAVLVGGKLTTGKLVVSK